MDRIYRLVKIVFLSSAFLCGLTSCGVKAPPLPPESATPQQSDRNGWSPNHIPSASASPTPTPRKT